MSSMEVLNDLAGELALNRIWWLARPESHAPSGGMFQAVVVAADEATARLLLAESDADAVWLDHVRTSARMLGWATDRWPPVEGAVNAAIDPTGNPTTGVLCAESTWPEPF